jgi:hypothetical protein
VTSRSWIRYAIATAAVVLIVGGSVWAWRARSHSKLLASIKDDPHKTIEAARAGKITEQERDAAVTGFVQNKVNATIDGYFALPEGKQRQDYLDKVIDEMQSKRKEIQAHAASRPALRQALESARPGTVTTTQPAPGQQIRIVRGGPGMLEGIPADRRAQLAEFMSAMSKRRAERGLPAMGPGGGPGLVIVNRVEK